MAPSEQAINDVAGAILDAALVECAAMYEDERPDVAYAIRRGIAA